MTCHATRVFFLAALTCLTGTNAMATQCWIGPRASFINLTYQPTIWLDPMLVEAETQRNMVYDDRLDIVKLDEERLHKVISIFVASKKAETNERFPTSNNQTPSPGLSFCFSSREDVVKNRKDTHRYIEDEPANGLRMSLHGDWTASLRGSVAKAPVSNNAPAKAATTALPPIRPGIVTKDELANANSNSLRIGRENPGTPEQRKAGAEYREMLIKAQGNPAATRPKVKAEDVSQADYDRQLLERTQPGSDEARIAERDYQALLKIQKDGGNAKGQSKPEVIVLNRKVVTQPGDRKPDGYVAPKTPNQVIAKPPTSGPCFYGRNGDRDSGDCSPNKKSPEPKTSGNSIAR